MDAAGPAAVVVLAVVMFLASVVAGTVPLVMSLAQQHMNMVGALAIGLLVGTSLGVVLPEGIETLYAGAESAEPRQTATEPGNRGLTEAAHHLVIALSLVLGYLVMHLLTFLPPLFLHNYGASPIPLASLSPSPRLERSPSSASIHIPDNTTGLSNATIGLSIHALADGIALGSSAVTDNVALKGIVFFAIMLHKVPSILVFIVDKTRHRPRSP
jgi:solute carrier family 39 (zinc transporter), member 9